MTPAARIAAAIEILDAYLAGAAAEQALTRWARASRFAGSKDRAAVRDHVFDALRNLRSCAAFGGRVWPDTTGRAVMIGALRAQDIAPTDLFTGEGHAPAELSAQEQSPAGSLSDQEAMNLPDWLCARFRSDLADRALDVAQALSSRAPITLRVNLRKSTRTELQTALASAGFETAANPNADTALTLQGHARGLLQTEAFQAGMFELQDANSQAIVAGLELAPGARILDLCAGGGGKSLALAALYDAKITAHDIDSKRMKDLPTRAKRAGVKINVTSDLSDLDAESFDLVLVDAPCSGSGAWRRAPDAKWRFTSDRLHELEQLQREILDQSQRFVRPGGQLLFATCSILTAENAGQADAFLTRSTGWHEQRRTQWFMDENGDGFFALLLIRE